MEIVSLDEMGGFEFQRFVAHLFEQLGFGKTKKIRRVRDAGRDVLLQSPDGGLIVVECKHHPKGTIGRPVVQKLHSAVITAQAKKGFVVTTGRFSRAAAEYAKGLGSLIELVDSRILYDMAKRAGIKLLKKGERTAIYHVIPSSQELIEQILIQHIIDDAVSHPNTPDQLAKITVTKTHFIPTYHLEYSLHQNFSTTVGVIHSVNVDEGHILISGQDGHFLRSELVRMLTPSSMDESWYPQKQEKVSSGRFKLGYSYAKRGGTKHIQEYHTETVGYYGLNNVYYTKRCVPNASSILIRSITQVYLPILTVSCDILKRQHKLSLCGNRMEVEILDHSAKCGICEICGKKLEGGRLLCNSCGRIVHAPSFMGHAYLCEICGKTICKECTYWTRKYLFFKKKLCEECAESLERKGKKVRKLTSTHDMSTAKPDLGSVLDLEQKAIELEKGGELEEAKQLYWQIVSMGFEGSFPYERLRIIHAKQGDLKGAIEACKAYANLNSSYMGYDVKRERMKEWIRKYQARLNT